MGMVSSLILFAVGAILRFATTVTTNDFNLHTIGVILMIVGVVGFIASIVFWASWGGFGGSSRGRSRRVYRRGDGTVVEEQQDIYQ